MMRKPLFFPGLIFLRTDWNVCLSVCAVQGVLGWSVGRRHLCPTCMCVCVCEREREGGRGGKRGRMQAIVSVMRFCGERKEERKALPAASPKKKI